MNKAFLRPLLSIVLVGLMSVAGNAYASQPVDLNTATVQQLEQIKGIGPTRANAIVAYRSQHKRFSKVAELIQVKGIGAKTLAKLKNQLTVHGAKASK